MHALLIILVSMLLLPGTTAQARELSREQAVKRLSHVAVQARREATVRLGEVGIMADVPALLKALRDSDEDTRQRAEQAIWRIWARSGNQEVDALYQTGIEQMNAGTLQQAIVTFTRIIELKPDFAEGWKSAPSVFPCRRFAQIAGRLRRGHEAQPLSLRRALRVWPDLRAPRILRPRARVFSPRTEGQPQHGRGEEQHRAARALGRAAAQANDLIPRDRFV